MKKQLLFEIAVIISMISFGSLLVIGLMVIIETNNILGGIGWIILSFSHLFVMYILIKNRKAAEDTVFVINNDKSNELSKFGNKILDGFKKK